MSTIQSSAEHLTLNADGNSKDIKFQANGVEKASISSSGAFTSTSIDATKLTGALPAISGANLTGIADATKLPLAGGTMTGNIYWDRDGGSGGYGKILFKAEDSSGDDSIYCTVNDGQGNFGLMLGVNDAGASTSSDDGASKLLFAGHGGAGGISLNACQAGSSVSFTAGLLVDSVSNSIRVGASNNSTGLTAGAGTKIADMSGNLFSATTAKAWVSIDGVGTVGANDSYNISSISDNGVGRYTINIDTNMVNTNYVVTAMCQGTNYDSAYACLHGGLSAGSFPIRVRTGANTDYIDTDQVMLAIFGD